MQGLRQCLSAAESESKWKAGPGAWSEGKTESKWIDEPGAVFEADSV